MNVIKVGIIGNGNYGKKIISKLKSLKFVDIKWICDSKSEWWNKESVDWVFLCSPCIMHYEQAKFFLNKKINVFSEKPFSYTVKALQEVISLAEKNDCKFYISDIYYYKDTLKQTKFVFKKKDLRLNVNILYGISYHHFYTIYKHFNFKNWKIKNLKIKVNEHHRKQFQFEIEDTLFKFDYDFNQLNRNDNLKIKNGCVNDAMALMIETVLLNNKKSLFEENKKRSIFSTFLCESLRIELYGKCAVIGAGIYGLTTALKLSEAGFLVDVYDENDSILSGASSKNQQRLHRGYHYPRSEETIKSCKLGYNLFSSYYNKSVNKDIKKYYSICSENGYINSEEYLKILTKNNLHYNIKEKLKNFDITVEVFEPSLDLIEFKNTITDRIESTGINLFMSNKILSDKNLSSLNYKNIIFCLYANLGKIFEKKNPIERQLVEEVIVKLPEQFKNKSLVVMDGPFFCIDAIPNTDYHMIGAVEESIHFKNEDLNDFLKFDNCSTHIDTAAFTKIKSKKDKIISLVMNFIPEISKIEYINSLFVIKTLLLKCKNSERPFKIVKNEKCLYVLGGKIVGSLKCSEKVLKNVIDFNNINK
jgi:hypothetical protein